jgi:tetratricopeptide (TPR) repeat protein
LTIYKWRTIVLFCPLLFFIPYAGKGSTFFDSQLVQAYYQTLDLKLREEFPVLESAEIESTENKAFQIYIKNLNKVLDLLLVKDKVKFKTYFKEEKLIYRILESLDKDDPYVVYVNIELKTHRGLLKLRYGERISGALNLIQAYQQINNYEQTYTGYTHTLKTSGLLNVIISLFPDQLNWILNMMQVNPDYNKGINYLKELWQSQSIFKREGLLLYALSQSFFGDQGVEAAELLNSHANDFDNSLLYSYLSGLISIKNKDNEAAIAYFDSCLKFGRNYLQIPLINYYRAESYLKALNFNKAAYLYELFLEKPGGDEFIKDSYYKLYNLAVLFNIKERNIDNYRQGVINSGGLNTGSDRYANNRITNNYIPNKVLFKSRILFDGGYYEQSLDVLYSQKPSDSKSREHLFEYLYRLARNYQQINQNNLSIEYFNKVVAEEDARVYYFWGNSLLNLGNIYSRMGDYDAAREFYNKAIKYKGDEYRSSIRMEAKTALKKIEDL